MAGYSVVVEVMLTDKLRKYFRVALTKSDLPDYLKKQIKTYASESCNVEDKIQCTVPYEVVKLVHLVVGDNQVYLHDLLEGSDVNIPVAQTPERNPELEVRIQTLRNRQSNREYEQMTRNVDLSHMNRKYGSFKQEIKQVNTQLIAVINCLLTVIGSFVFVYKATEYAMEKPNVPIQLCNGLIAGTIVFFADMYFLIKNTI